ncbi:MAG: YwiC-like family protein, partial [Acidimicrobiia bacterium]
MSTAAQPRAPWRSVAIPDEHGGWGLTAEPALLGLLVAPSWAGVLLAAAAFLAFMVRTPLKVVLVDQWRRRRLPRTRVAARIAAVELAALL